MLAICSSALTAAPLQGGLSAADSQADVEAVDLALSPLVDPGFLRLPVASVMDVSAGVYYSLAPLFGQWGGRQAGHQAQMTSRCLQKVRRARYDSKFTSSG